MPSDEIYTAQAQVKVNGSPLPDDVSLTGLVVDSSRSVPDMFTMRFVDEEARALSKSGLTVGATVQVDVVVSGSGSPVTLLKGEVTSLEAEFGSDGTSTVVRGLDSSHRLFRGRRMEAYVDSTVSDIVRKVVSRAGLQVGQIDSGGSVLKHVSQDNVSDWDFLASLAAKVGTMLRVAEGAVSFVEPTEASTAPAPTPGSAFVFERGDNLIALRATVTAAGLVPEVEVRGWDVAAKREIVGTAPARTVSATLPDADPAALASAISAQKLVESAPGLPDQSSVQERAESLAEQISAGFAELEGTVLGNPALKTGVAVSLQKMGSPFDGKYVLSSVRHEFAFGQYSTSFTVAGGSERSLLGAVVGATGLGKARLGISAAIVTDIKDPENISRVRFKLPTFSDTYESGWARVVQTGAGANRGLGMLPEVGDEVLVAFEDGDADRPYVLGGLYNGRDAPDADQVGSNDGKVEKRSIVSRTGMRVEFVEKAGAEELVIATSDGEQKLRLVQKGQALVELISKGPLKVVAEQDVTVESQQNVSVTTTSGNVTVKGVDVSVEGSKSLTLKAPQVTVQGSATTDIKGAQVKVAADAQVEVSGNAMATIRGALVKIN